MHVRIKAKNGGAANGAAVGTCFMHVRTKAKNGGAANGVTAGAIFPLFESALALFLSSSPLFRPFLFSCFQTRAANGINLMDNHWEHTRGLGGWTWHI